MKDGIGEGFTHADHPALAHQLYAAYARAINVRKLASVVGTEGLPPSDRRFLELADRFETRLVNQSAPRTLEESMRVGWEDPRRDPRARAPRA